MTRRRFIADRWDRAAATAELLGPQALHLGRVLRAEPGQVYDLVAGGFLHRAEIRDISLTAGAERVAFRLYEELEADVTLPLHLILAVFKFDHLEWAIEKATELGVARITPVLAHRTEKHLSQAAGKRVDRWRRIALEATKQSRRTSPPEIDDPVPVREALALIEPSASRILLSEVEQANALTLALRALPPASPVVLAIGPEGGWTPDELSLFAAERWQPVTLGPRILRAETAAVAAVAIAGALLGDSKAGTSSAPAPDPREIPLSYGAESS